jgi:MarR family transcriptional regulator, transcriptional regulator for hemolysin
VTDLGEEVYQKCREKITELEQSVMEGIDKEEQTITFQTSQNTG